MILKDEERRSNFSVSLCFRMRQALQGKDMFEEHTTHPMCFLLPPSMAVVDISNQSLTASLPLMPKATSPTAAGPAAIFSVRPSLALQLKDPTSPALMNSAEAIEVTIPFLEKLKLTRRINELEAKSQRLQQAIMGDKITVEDYVNKLKEDLAADTLLITELKTLKRMNEAIVVIKRTKAMQAVLDEM